ncbi:unnamed protein product, partial [Rotaria magnacalcarata]
MEEDESMKTRIQKRSPPLVTWKHSWSTNEMQNALTASDFKLVPTEVMLQIFKFLSVHDL